MKKYGLRETISKIIQDTLLENGATRGDMKKLIIQSLNNTFSIVEDQLPKIKTSYKTQSVIDVSPTDLPSFMKRNNIPNDASFTSRNSEDDILLYWKVEIPLTEKDKTEFKKRKFDSIYFK